MVKNHRSKLFLCAVVGSVLQYSFAVGQQLEQYPEHLRANIALLKAVSGDRINIGGVRAALEAGANPACPLTVLDALSNDLREPLRLELGISNSEDETEESWGNTVPRKIFFLAPEGSQEAAILLLEKGLSKDYIDKDGVPILTHACINGWRNVVQLLVNMGANCNKPSNSGETPLGEAAGRGDIHSAQLLIAGGAEVNAICNDEDEPNFGNMTALTRAVFNNKNSFIKLLVDNGADINHPACRVRGDGSNGPGGYTPLLIAASQGNWSIVHYFWQHGADVNARSADGAIAFLCALLSQARVSAKITKFLITRGARMPTQEDLENWHLYIKALLPIKRWLLSNLQQAFQYSQQRELAVHELLNAAAGASLGRAGQIPRDLTRYMLQKFEQGRES